MHGSATENEMIDEEALVGNVEIAELRSSSSLSPHVSKNLPTVNEHSEPASSSSSCCLICYDVFDDDDDDKQSPYDLPEASLVVSSLGGRDSSSKVVISSCQHAYCRGCLYQHCFLAIQGREKLPITCPASVPTTTTTTTKTTSSGDGGPHASVQSCTATLEDPLVHRVVCCHQNEQEEEEVDLEAGWTMTTIKYCRHQSDTWKRYRRLQRQQQDPTLIACPSCDELVSTTSTTCSSAADLTTLSSTEAPVSGEAVTSITPAAVSSNNGSMLSCQECLATFCTIHGEQHPGMTCQEFLKSKQGQEMQEQEAMSIEAIRKTTKPCPRCGVYIEKSNGCNRVYCTSCNKPFCFKCGTYEHLSGEFGHTCFKCHPHHSRTCLLWAPCWLPFAIIYVALSVTVALASCFCCCCCFCACLQLHNSRSRRKAFTTIQVCLGVIFHPVVVVWQSFRCTIGCCRQLDTAMTETSDMIEESGSSKASHVETTPTACSTEEVDDAIVNADSNSDDPV